jgi:hypothetical protein
LGRRDIVRRTTEAKGGPMYIGIGTLLAVILIIVILILIL